MLSLQEYIYEQQNINLIDESLYPSYISIFNKIDIYNRNTKLINEGYTKLHNNILYTPQERHVINVVLENYMNDVLCSYIINEKLTLDGAKQFLTSGKEKVKELINKFINVIPKEVIEAYELIAKVVKSGIKTAEDLINTIGKLLVKLGENIVEALEKLRLFNDEFCSKLPDSNSEILGKIVDIKDDNQKKLVAYIISNVNDKLQNKKDNVNESILSKEQKLGASIALSATFFPNIALLAGGGYGLYKLLKYVGPKLSEKLEPYLLSDKTKEFANNLYKNKFARYAIGLDKSDDSNKSDSKLKTIGKILWSIFVNFIIATLVSSVISLFVTSFITSGPAAPIIIASIIGTRNIFKIVINRILNFKKEKIKANGEVEKQFFFDMVTMVGILSSIISIVIKIPEFRKWFTDIFHKVYDIKPGQMQAAMYAKGNSSDDIGSGIKWFKEVTGNSKKAAQTLQAHLDDLKQDLGANTDIRVCVVEPDEVDIYCPQNMSIDKLEEKVVKGWSTFGNKILDMLQKEPGVNILHNLSWKTATTEDGHCYIAYFYTVDH